MFGNKRRVLYLNIILEKFATEEREKNWDKNTMQI